MTTTNILTGSATLNWQSVSGAQIYILQWKPASSTIWTTIPDISTNSYNLTSLDPFTKYNFRVLTVCNSGSSSDYSVAANFITKCNSPSRLLASDITGNSAIVSWAGTAGATSYNLQWRPYYDIAPPGAWTYANALTSTSYQLSNLAPATNYEFMVSSNCSPLSDRATFTTTCQAPPVGLIVRSIAATTAVASWVEVLGADGYNVEWKTSTASNWNTIQNLTTPFYQFTGLTQGTAYMVRVSTICHGVSSSFSSGFNFITVCGPATTDLAATNITGSSAVLSWKQVPFAKSYLLQWKRLSAGTWNTASVLPNTSYSLTGLVDGTTYTFQVSIICTNGSSLYSTPLNFTTACSSPEGLRAINITNTSALMTWNAIPGITSYTLQWKPTSSNTWITLTGIKSQSYSQSKLSPGTSYTFQVLTICNNGTSNYSNPAIFTTIPSSNANLSNLVISSGRLTPSFSQATTSYTATVASTVSSIIIVPTAADAVATVRVNNDPEQPSGTHSFVGLNEGLNTIKIIVTAQNGTTKTYTVIINRMVSTVYRIRGGADNPFPLHILSSWVNESGKNPSDFGVGKTFLLSSAFRGVFDEYFNPYILTANWTVEGTIKPDDNGIDPPVILLNGFTLSAKDVRCMLAGSSQSNLIVTGESPISFFDGVGLSETGFLNKLVINTGKNNETVTLKSPVRIYDELKIQSGELKAAIPPALPGLPEPPSPITLLSSSSTTARVAPVTGKINIPVTVERFIPARHAWRLLSAPVKGSQSINSAWQEGATTASPIPNPKPGYGTHITGGSIANGFDQSSFGVAGASLLKYAPPTNTWTPVSNTKNTLVSNEAHMLFIRGDRGILLGNNSVPPTNTILRSTGLLKTGNQTFAVNASGFTLIPNPFASPINFATLTRNNVQNNFYLWDPKLGGVYGVGGYILLSYNGSGYDVTPAAVSPESQYIQSGQAFFVRSTGVIGSLVIKESDKSATAATNVFRSSNNTYGIRTTLQVVDKDSGASLLDETFTAYGSNYSNQLDAFDPVKLSNISENIGVDRNGQTLMVERRQSFVGSDTIYLSLSNLKLKEYTLHFSPENLLTNSIKSAVLIDDYLKTITPISLSEGTSFRFKIEDKSASSNPHRFFIVLNASGKATSGDIPFTKGAFKIFPNPITGKILNIQFINQPKGTYNVEVVNSLGQVTIKEQIRYTGGNLMMPVFLKNRIAEGIYQVNISNQSTNTRSTITVIGKSL